MQRVSHVEIDVGDNWTPKQIEDFRKEWDNMSGKFANVANFSGMPMLAGFDFRSSSSAHESAVCSYCGTHKQDRFQKCVNCGAPE